ncbi:MAG: 3'-5' exonuclease, partial [Armatimonadota bacterium]
FDALCATHGSGFSAEFVWQEWERVIDAWNIRSVEEYLRFERIGRGVPLNPRQREQLWSLFAAMRQRLLNAGIMTPNLACYELANRFQKKPPFRCVIADEAQDFGPAQMRLLQSLAPADQPDNLFFCVDVAQRIYARSVPWVHYNIDVRGRSMRLRINYRNTLQIQRAAERVLPPERQAELARAWDEQEDIQTGLRPVPCLRGLDPELVACESYEEERRRLTNWLQRCHADGIPYNQIAILARSKELLSELVEPALRKLGLTSCPLGQGIVALDYQVYVGTAHASKGLEFRAVAIVGASDNMFPSQSAIISCADHHELQEVLQRERNLLYTAMMRPRERLYISWTGRRSRFLPAKV